MKQDQQPDARFTTMVDLYGIPMDFPKLDFCRAPLDPEERVRCLEEALLDDMERRFPQVHARQRLIPYIQLHEFEALLFADIGKFGEVLTPRDSRPCNRLNLHVGDVILHGPFDRPDAQAQRIRRYPEARGGKPSWQLRGEEGRRRDNCPRSV